MPSVIRERDNVHYIPEDIDAIAAGNAKDPEGRLRALRPAAFARFQLAKREGFLTIGRVDKSKTRQLSSGILHYIRWCYVVNCPYVEIAVSGKYALISYTCDPTGYPYTCNPTEADLQYFQTLLSWKGFARDAQAGLGQHHTAISGVPKAEAVVIARQIAATLIARTRMTAEERDQYRDRAWREETYLPQPCTTAERSAARMAFIWNVCSGERARSRAVFLLRSRKRN